MSEASGSDEEIRRLVAQGRLSRKEMAARMQMSERTFYRRLKSMGLS